jgi:hypothetical protein
MGIFSYVKLGKKIFGKQKTTGTEVINKVTPKVSTKLSKLKIETAKSKGKFKKTMDSISRDVSKTGAAFKKITQKLKGEKVTESGVSKGKDLRENKMGGGMMGRRMGYSEGTKPISRSKNPGLLAMSKTAKGKEAVKKMKFNPDRIVAKKGGKA